MASCSVFADPTSLTRSSGGQVSGRLFVELAGQAFPEPAWSDSIVIVLAAWLKALRDFDITARESRRLHFMDGPFVIELVHLPAGQYRAEGVRTNNGQRMARANCDGNSLLLSCAHAAAAVGDECALRGWTSRDIVELRVLASKVISTAR